MPSLDIVIIACYNVSMKSMQEPQQMDEESIAAAVEGWGYRVLPRAEGGSFGYGSLLVAIRKEPTRQHFDPQRLRFRLRDASGDVRWRTASWRSSVDESGPICPGPVILHDRFEKEVEFFTFGGTIDVVSNPSALIYAFRSSAPILELVSPDGTVSDQLAYEAEGILARMEERWLEQYDEGFAARLTEIAPFSLYTAILNAIILRYQGEPALKTAFRTLYAALEQEKAHLSVHGLWPEHVPDVEDLLVPSV
jgi:hypothetical protein